MSLEPPGPQLVRNKPAEIGLGIEKKLSDLLNSLEKKLLLLQSLPSLLLPRGAAQCRVLSQSRCKLPGLLANGLGQPSTQPRARGPGKVCLLSRLVSLCLRILFAQGTCQLVVSVLPVAEHTLQLPWVLCPGSPGLSSHSPQHAVFTTHSSEQLLLNFHTGQRACGICLWLLHPTC